MNPDASPTPKDSTRDAVVISLSRFFTTRAPLEAGAYQFFVVLEEIAQVTLKGERPHPPPTWGPRPTVEAVLRRRGLSADELVSAFDERRLLEGEDARLDVDLLLELCPAPYWTVVSKIIADGPKAAGRRIELAMAAHAKRVVPPTSARPAGGLISQESLETRLKKVMKFLSILVDLQHRVDGIGLDAWTVMPRIALGERNPRQVTDTTPPSLALLRRILAELDRDAERALGCPPDKQASRVREWGAQAPSGLLLLLRSRVELGLLCCVGMRIGALTRLTVGDVVASRPRLGPDGGNGPAIALRPEKTLSQNHIRIKPIPEGLFWRIEAYLAYVEGRIGASLAETNPLLVADTKHFGRPLTAKAIRSRLGQSRSWTQKLKNGEVVSRSRPPLLVRPDGTRGYSPHTLRSATFQMIRSSLGAQWLDSYRAQQGDLRLPTNEIALAMISDVLLDHQVKEDLLGYGGGKKEVDRERLAGYGTELTWALLTTDAGARKIPDVPRFRAALIQRRAAESELVRIEEITSDTRCRIRSKEIPFEEGHFALEDLHDKERRVRQQLTEVADQLRHLRDPQSFVALDDDRRYVPVDLDEIERNELAGATDYDRRRHKPVRDWITPKELAQILGMGEASIRRWLKGRFPSGPRPWDDPNNPPIDESYGPKRRRLMLSGLNDGLFPSELAKEKLAETLARWPEGWSRAATEDPSDRGARSRVLET